MIKRFTLFISTLFTLYLISLTPLNNYRKSFTRKSPPQIILVLGGDVNREYAGIKLAKKLGIPLIVSGGSNPEHANWLVEKSGLSASKVKLDYRAKDTLGNFTSLVDEFAAEGINQILLITSKDHLYRALAIGYIVAGSRGISISSYSVACEPNCQVESLNKQIVDAIRALIWVTTKKDIKGLKNIKWEENIYNYFDQAFSKDLQRP